jgi:suppressor for copper-sensitivity B
MVLGVSPENTSAATVQRDAADKIAWLPFDRGEIARRVSRGEVVLLDVTADWCLTCKVNKALVLEREPVLSALQEKDVALMQADWTRPSDRIARFLESNNRYGIPFNAVYGPGSPKGTILSEVLSSDSVLEALSNARKASASRPGKANNN